MSHTTKTSIQTRNIYKFNIHDHKTYPLRKLKDEHTFRIRFEIFSYIFFRVVKAAKRAAARHEIPPPCGTPLTTPLLLTKLTSCISSEFLYIPISHHVEFLL